MDVSTLNRYCCVILVCGRYQPGYTYRHQDDVVLAHCGVGHVRPSRRTTIHAPARSNPLPAQRLCYRRHVLPLLRLTQRPPDQPEKPAARHGYPRISRAPRRQQTQVNSWLNFWTSAFRLTNCIKWYCLRFGAHNDVTTFVIVFLRILSLLTHQVINSLFLISVIIVLGLCVSKFPKWFYSD